MVQFNLKKKQNRKKLYSKKNNILSKNGNELINDKLKLIKQDFHSCLFIDEIVEIKTKKIIQYDICNIDEINEINKEYSGVISNFGTQMAFANNLDSSIKSIYNRLSKDGLFCFNLLTPKSMKTISKIFIEIDENVFKGTFNRFGPFHDVSTVIEKLSQNSFKEIVVGTNYIEFNYKSFDSLRGDFRDFGISNYYKNVPKFKKEFLIKTYSVFSKIIEKYNYIPVEFEIATFTSWK